MKLVSERKFPVAIGEEATHFEETPNGTAIDFTWQFGPNRSENSPDRLRQYLTVILYSYGQVVWKRSTLSHLRHYEEKDYKDIGVLFNNSGIEVSVSDTTYRLDMSELKRKSFGKESASYPSIVSIQKLQVVQKAPKTWTGQGRVLPK